MHEKLKKYGTTVSLVVALTGMSVFALWERVGWQTPHGHKIDVESKNTAVLSAINAANTQAQTRYEHWLCDEDYEELEDVRVNIEKAQLAGRTSAELRHREDSLRERMRGNDCARFADLD